MLLYLGTHMEWRIWKIYLFERSGIVESLAKSMDLMMLVNLSNEKYVAQNLLDIVELMNDEMNRF